jgi:lipid A ethanolaminephosphotransferase
LKKITDVKLIVLTSIFLVIFDNVSFYKNVTSVYQITMTNIGFLISLVLGLVSLLVLLLVLTSSRYTTKPILILFVCVASLANYFMNEYGIIVDDIMIQSIINTDIAETVDLINVELILYFLVFGVLPSILIYKANIIHGTWKNILKSKLMPAGISLLIIIISLASFGDFYASFLREHKPLRYYTNPTYLIYSAGKYTSQFISQGKNELIPIGLDAKIPDGGIKRKLIILVVGETARADRFSLNGYGRKTNPFLEKESVLSFKNFYSCGTSTATSVPCMFSFFGRDDFDKKKGNTYTNLLDVMKIAGVNVLWRDNNSSSKGVAMRVPYEDFRSSKSNMVCDAECRDVGMLIGLQEYVDKNKTGSILIVLHQMGNHGPAYYKRYPRAHEVFKPACQTNHLEQCSAEKINNAYDNAIRYTDYFLSKIIELLKANSDRFETAMFYISDHGESLGENNLYLHGMPYFMAPEAQKHVPAILWLGKSFNVDRSILKTKIDRTLSHDNIFHTVLGLMGIESDVYFKNLDILSKAN